MHLNADPLSGLDFSFRKLLKKVDFLQWKQDANLREIKVMRRYHIQQREDYQAYNRLCGSIRGLAHKLAQLPEQDPFRTKYEDMLLSKLYDMGVMDITAKISDIEGKVTVSALCRRRLAVVMCRLKMCETVSRVGVICTLTGHPRTMTVDTKQYLLTGRPIR